MNPAHEAVQVAEVRRLNDDGFGEDAISRRLKITRHHARKLVARVRMESSAVIIPPSSDLPTLSFYDTARQALGQAKTLAEVKSIGDKAAAMQEYARRLNDKTLEIDAAEICIRAKYELGKGLIAIKETRGLAKGGKPFQQPKLGSKPTADGPEAVDVRPPTLADIGVNERQSRESQKLAKSIPETNIEARIASWRQNAEKGARVTVDILRGGPIDGARAVMGSRQEPSDSLDYFSTPPWATRALVERVFARLNIEPPWRRPGWDPACGEGHMSDVLAEYGPAIGTDIFDYGANGLRRAETWSGAIDFLTEFEPPEVDWIITNSPFGDRALAFALRALDISRFGVALFVQSRWTEGVDRYERLFSDRPPTLISYFAERVPLCKGRWNPDGDTATAYCWLVWVKDRAPLPPFWIPPGCREALTKPTDRARFAAWSLPPDGRAESAT